MSDNMEDNYAVYKEQLNRIENKVDQLIDLRSQKKYLNMAEAAEYTGFSISRLRNFIDEGKLESKKPGGNKIMFKPEWLDRLFD